MRHSLILAAALIAACSDSTAPTINLGQYALVSVDGGALPHKVNDSLTVYTGAIDLGFNGRYNATFCYTPEGPPCWLATHIKVSDIVVQHGRYLVRGDSLFLNNDGGEDRRLRIVTPDSLVETRNGLALAFARHPEGQ